MIMDGSFSQSGSAHQVKQFHITNWAFDGSCSNLSTVTDVIEQVVRQPVHCETLQVSCGPIMGVSNE